MRFPARNRPSDCELCDRPIASEAQTLPVLFQSTGAIQIVKARSLDLGVQVNDVVLHRVTQFNRYAEIT